MALEFSIEIDDNGTPKLRKFQKETKKTGSVSKSASKAIGAIGKGLAVAGAAAGVAGAALFTLTKGVAESRDKITKLGRELGLSTEFLSGMGHAAQLGGSDLKTVNKAFSKLSRTAADAQSGLATAKKGFTDLGINIEDANGVMKTNDQLLFEIADKFKEMPNGVIKAAKAQEIFGKSGKNLINTLNQGSEALKKQIGEAKDLGIAFSEKAGKEAEAFNDALLRLETSAQGSLAPIGEEMIPIMTKAFGGLQTAIETAGPGLVRVFEDMVPALEFMLDLLVDTAIGWADLIEQYGKLSPENIVKVNKALEVQGQLRTKQARGIQLTQKQLIKESELQDFLLKTYKMQGKSVDDLRIAQSQAKIKELAALKKVEGATEFAIAQVDESIDKELEKIKAIKQVGIAKQKEADAEKQAAKDKAMAERIRQANELKKARDAEKQAAKAAKDAEAAIKREQQRIQKESDLRDQAAQKTLDARKAADEIYNDMIETRLQNEADVNREIAMLNMTEFERKKFLIEEEFKAREDVVGKTIELEKSKAQALSELEQEQSNRRKENLIAQFDNIAEITSNVSGALAAITQAEQNNINAAFEERSQKVEDFYNRQIKQAEGNADKQEKLQRERDEKLRRLEEKREKDLQKAAKKTAEARKRAAQLEIIVNTAAAVTKAGVITPLAIATSFAGAAQLVAAESAQYFKGGMTPGEQQTISVGENGPEFVVSSGGTRAAGEAALEDINNGRLEDAANKLIGKTSGQSGGVNLYIQGGVIDEQFLENTLLPKLEQLDRRS